MHEMSLAQGVIDIVAEAARAHRAARILRVRLRIGALSHVEPEALRFCFDVVARGTAAEGAALAIDQPAGTAWCAGCETDVTIASRGETCPACGSARLLVTGGDDMTVQDLEVA